MTPEKRPRFRMGYIVSRVHRALYQLLNGRFVSGRGNVSFLLLSTRGRRSQRTRTLPLLYLMHNGDPCVIASKGGSPVAPDWLFNIRTNPEVAVQVGGLRWEGTARIASGEEREQLWPRFVECYSGYEGYQTHTTRIFPIVVITRSEE
ncbi:MAG: nitroreductase family deazaflavin-dependent oxidoreductase [Planctomycetota bacterium]|nr:MAG: nitroreductase family deazaflavin-dependent oxidoreductase [Planctomycetota bacterium]